MSKFLFDWDSIGYALAFQNYDLSIAQPQPPGYIFYVALGKIINVFFRDPNTTMVFISILFSIFTVFLIYFLTKRMFSRKIAVISSILLVFNPIFWFYGEIAAIYMNEALFATLIAYSSYQLLKGDDRFLLVSSIVLGLSGGFRPDLMVFMLPLWFFCLIYREFNYKKIFRAIVVSFASAMLWFIPTILLSGGYWNYLLLNHGQLIPSLKGNSILLGGNIVTQLMMNYQLISWTLIGLGLFNLMILCIFVTINWKTVSRWSIYKNYKFIFLSLWFLPSFIFYLLIYIGKPGYILVYLPIFSLIIGFTLVNVSLNLNLKFKKITLNYFIIIMVTFSVLFSTVQFISHDKDGINYSKIQISDNRVHYINKSLKEFNPNNSVVIFELGGDWRKSMYYHPEFETYYYENYNQSGTTMISIVYAKNHEIETYNIKNLTIKLNSSIDNVVWIINNDSDFINQLKSKIEIKSITLPDGNVVFYFEINKNRNSTIVLY